MKRASEIVDGTLVPREDNEEEELVDHMYDHPNYNINEEEHPPSLREEYSGNVTSSGGYIEHEADNTENCQMQGTHPSHQYDVPPSTSNDGYYDYFAEEDIGNEEPSTSYVEFKKT
eukprot:Nk52_evm52s2531 gene=Nk52_evmTU52s2531